MILAGDIGGTKTLLALFRHGANGLETVREQSYASTSHAQFDSLMHAFVGTDTVTAACFGVAGPVRDGVCRATNLPWVLEETTLSGGLGGAPVRLLNDLQAAALGMLRLPAGQYVELNPLASTQARSGTTAVIAAGTGLGEAILYWDGQRYHALPTEGGHCDFAPNTPLEDALLVWLRSQLGGHVSYERILSGSGFSLLYRFLRDSSHAAESAGTAARMAAAPDANAVVTELGLAGEDALCVEALRLFARIYGAEAGNLALKCLAGGGVWVGGGIAPKILPALREGAFLEGFLDKGRFRALLESLPVRVALEPRAPLIGAAWQALEVA